MEMDKAIEIGKTLYQQVGYEEHVVTELIIEEFRLYCKDCAKFIKAVFWRKETNKLEHAKKAIDILRQFFQMERVERAIKEVYNLSEDEWSETIRQDSVFVTIDTYIKKIRANDFGTEYRCYLWLDNIGVGKAGWAYIIPDTPEANVIMDFALKAIVDQTPVYVHGKLDKDNGKLKILELGFNYNS